MAGATIYHRAAQSILLVGLKSNLGSTWEAFFLEKLPYYELHYSYDTFKKSKHRWRVLLLNYEALDRNLVTRMRKFEWDLIVYDECQRLKSRSSQSSRFARSMATGRAKARLGLSGTPMDDSPIDLWAIFRFLKPDLFGLRWSDFRDQWTRPSGYMGKTPLFREHLHGRFSKRIRPYVFRAVLEDLGIERAKIVWRKIDLEPQQERAYRKLEANSVLKLGRSKVTTPLAITNITKLQQITGGWVYDDEDRVVHVGNAKRRDLRKWLLDKEGPVVIFCKFTPDVDICVEEARRQFDRVAVLTGKVKDKGKNRARTQLLLDFQRGKYDVIVCQQKTGGAGVDLFIARHAYVYSCGHSYIDFDQMSARLTFLKQSGAARFEVPYAAGTVDGDIRVAVRSKRSVTEVVWERLRRRNKPHG